MKALRFMFLLGFVGAANFHLYLAFFPSEGDVALGTFHLTFVFIHCMSFGLLMWDNPKGLLLLTPLIGVGLYDHLPALYRVWTTEHRIDWPSAIVLSALPVLGFYIFKKNKSSN